jgi:protein CpxP
MTRFTNSWRPLAAVASVALLAACAQSRPIPVADASTVAAPVQQPAAQQPAAQQTAVQQTPAEATAPPPGTGTMHHPMQMAETRIKELHTKLHITTQQEVLWGVVAQAMRDNAEEMEGLIQARMQNKSQMGAIENLGAFEQITQAHADGIKKFVAALQPLYDDMTPAQQKNADLVFQSMPPQGPMGKQRTVKTT